MRIHVCGVSFKLTDAIVRHAKSQIAAALTTTRARARGAIAWLGDINGTRGGVDKSCRIMVRLNGRGALVAESVDEDLYAAITHAAATLRETARRRLARHRTLQRKDAQRIPRHAWRRLGVNV